MKNKILVAVYFVAAHLGLIWLFYWINRKNKIVLTYHNIIPDGLFDHSHHLGVSHGESVFEKQIQLIRRRFITNFKKREIRCLITFDDGYKNQLEIAARILSSYGLQGVFFVSFRSITTGCTLAIDRIMMWMSYVPIGNYIVLGSGLLINDSSRHLAISNIYEKLIRNFELWCVVENELNAAYPFDMLSMDPELARLRFEPLNSEDLKMLSRQGHLVGAHSWGHQPLSTLPLELQKEDFSTCALLSSKYCNSKLYSYPFGGIEEVAPSTARLCAEYGFNAGYMNMPVAPEWPGVDAKFTLARFSLPNESNKYLLDAKLSGFEAFCKKYVKKLQSQFF